MNQMNKSEERRGRLFGLQVVELLDETLELGYDVVALVGGESLIDGEGHGLDCGAHLADGDLIVLRGVLVQIDEHGAQFPGDALGRARLMEEGEQFLLELLSVGERDLLGIGEREAPFSDECLLIFRQGPQPVFQPVDRGIGPLLEPLRRGGLHEAHGFVAVFLQGVFEGAHLARIDGGEQDASVGGEPIEEVGAEAIEGGIGPVDILAGEPSFELLSDLHEEGFVLRNGFVPVPCQQRREPQGQVVALVRGEIEVVIDLPEDDPVGIAIGEGERAAGEENQQTGDAPRPQAMSPCSIFIMCRAVDHGACRKEPGCPSMFFLTPLL
jgi:hypothetical protein